MRCIKLPAFRYYFHVTRCSPVDPFHVRCGGNPGSVYPAEGRPIMKRNSPSFVPPLVLGLAASFAVQAPTWAEEYRGTVDQQLACTPDVFRLCGSEIPDVNRIVACLRQNTPQLGPSCRAVFEAQNRVPPPVAPRERVGTSRIAR